MDKCKKKHFHAVAKNHSEMCKIIGEKVIEHIVHKEFFKKPAC
jgi:hypothetical protein